MTLPHVEHADGSIDTCRRVERIVKSPELLTVDCDTATNDVADAHLVGIGGAGMRALADVLRGQGWRVGGSDVARTDIAHAAIGHRAENVGDDVRLVVHS